MFDGISDEWLEIIKPDEVKEIEQQIDNMTDNILLCPPKHQWFEFARLTSLSDIKVIILGQDPYHTQDDNHNCVAHGLAFSSLSSKIPPSLLNIYKCLLNKKLIKKMPNHANLTEWAERGILLLNTALSTEAKTAKRHSLIWLNYIPGLIKRIAKYGTKHGKTYKFLLWGNDAKAYAKFAKNHEVMTWLHPSPMAQKVEISNRFINCDHFSNCDIDWTIKYNDHYIESKEQQDIYIPDKWQPEDDLLQAFTDGSCDKNGKSNAIGGCAAWFIGGPLKGKCVSKKIDKNATNIRAEGLAIISVLKRALVTENWTHLQIYTDSDFWVNMILNYMPKWSEKEFNNRKNPDLTKQMWSLWNKIDDLKPSRHKEIIWIPAHDKKNWSTSDDSYKLWCFKNNAKVDKFANEARMK